MIKVMAFNTGSTRDLLPGRTVLMIIPPHAVKILTSQDTAREN